MRWIPTGIAVGCMLLCAGCGSTRTSLSDTHPGRRDQPDAESVVETGSPTLPSSSADLTTAAASSDEVVRDSGITLTQAIDSQLPAPAVDPNDEPDVPDVDELTVGRDEGAPSPEPQGPIASPLTLDTIRELATVNNPTLVQATAQVQATYAKALQAGLYPNPTIAFAIEQAGLNDQIGEWAGGLVQQRFVTGDKLELSRAKYQARAQTAEFLAAAQMLRVVNDVTIHYYRACGAQRLVTIHEELLKTAQDELVTARELYNLGQANKADVHAANVVLQRARLDLKMTHTLLAMRMAELSALVGVPISRTTPLVCNDAALARIGQVCPSGCAPAFVEETGGLLDADSLRDFDAELVRILGESPELAAARAKLQADRITIEREEREPIPDIVVRGGVGRNPVDRQTTGMFEVMLEVPLFDRNQGTIRQAEMDLLRQQHEIRRTELDLQRRLSMVFEQYLSAWQAVYDYESIVIPQAKAAYAVSLESYKEDREDWPEVLRKQRAYYLTQVEYIRRWVLLRENVALLDGLLLHGALTAPPRPTPPGHIDSVPKPR